MDTNIIDLTYNLTDDMVVYPGNKRPVFQWVGRDNSEGYNLTHLEIIVHTGTHVDSPLHFIKNGQTVDAIDLNRLYGEVKLFTCKQIPYGQEIKIKDIMDSIDEVEPNSIFLIRTGIEDFGETEEYNKLFPCPSKELIDLLISKNIKSYMTDATSIDPFGTVNSENHHMLLGAGIPIVENLCNLSKLPNNNKFTISALPLRLKGREGSPCRAIAII